MDIPASGNRNLKRACFKLMHAWFVFQIRGGNVLIVSLRTRIVVPVWSPYIDTLSTLDHVSGNKRTKLVLSGPRLFYNCVSISNTLHFVHCLGLF